MKIIVFNGENTPWYNQWVKGLGYIHKGRKNFLLAIMRLEEILSGTLKNWKRKARDPQLSQLRER